MLLQQIRKNGLILMAITILSSIIGIVGYLKEKRNVPAVYSVLNFQLPDRAVKLNVLAPLLRSADSQAKLCSLFTNKYPTFYPNCKLNQTLTVYNLSNDEGSNLAREFFGIPVYHPAPLKISDDVLVRLTDWLREGLEKAVRADLVTGQLQKVEEERTNQEKFLGKLTLLIRLLESESGKEKDLQKDFIYFDGEDLSLVTRVLAIEDKKTQGRLLKTYRSLLVVSQDRLTELQQKFKCLKSKLIDDGTKAIPECKEVDNELETLSSLHNLSFLGLKTNPRPVLSTSAVTKGGIWFITAFIVQLCLLILFRIRATAKL